MLLKTVHYFLQLEVSEIKIVHRFQKYPPLHALSCRVSLSLPLTPAPDPGAYAGNTAAHAGAGYEAWCA